MFGGLRPLTEIVGPNWEPKLIELISESENQFTIVTPFVKEYGAKVILSNLSETVTLRTILSISKSDLIRGSSDYEAVYKLTQHGNSRNLPGLHAKVYLSDFRGLITSGNLTRAGLTRNTEFGVLIDDSQLHGQLHSELETLWNKAEPFVELPPIEKVQRDIKLAQDVQTTLEHSISARYLDSIFQQPKWQLTSSLEVKPVLSSIDSIVVNQSLMKIESILEEEGKRVSEIDSHEIAKNLRRRLRRTKFVFLDRDKEYSIQDFYSYARIYFSEFCDDSYLCDHELASQRPEWQHQVRWVVQDLKNIGILERADSRKWRFTDSNETRWSQRGQKTDQTCIDVIRRNPALLTQIRGLITNEEMVRWTDALSGVAPQWKKQGETDQIWIDKYHTRIPLFRRLIAVLEWLTQETASEQEEIWCGLRDIQYELGLKINMNPVKLSTIYQIIERYDSLDTR